MLKIGPKFATEAKKNEKKKNSKNFDFSIFPFENSIKKLIE